MKSQIQRLLIVVFILCNTITQASSFSKKDTNFVTYPICLHFQSVCCGVPEEKILKSWIAGFKKKYGIKKIKAFQVGPLGREGEYDLYFSLKGLKQKTANKFKAGIKKIVPKMIDPGMVTLEENLELNTTNLPSSITIKQVKY
ncbi:MAG: hypothetical protein RL582_663 [Bacteroidota bacterium]|jgi:hypothetical protein